MKVLESIEINNCDWKYLFKHGKDIRLDNFINSMRDDNRPFINDKYQLSHYLGGISFGSKTYVDDVIKFSRIGMFELIDNPEALYEEFSIKKKNGKRRTLYKVNDPLKGVQRSIVRNILSHYEISEYATAYKKGASIKKNAEIHSGKKYLLKMDLKDFFGHITYDMVLSLVFNSRSYSPFAKYALTKLCCYKGKLAQGAPTSPAISNIVMKHFDDVMGSWAKNNGISYSRYSDDITFSSNHKLYPAYVKAKSLLNKMGFEANEEKTHFVTNANRMIVNGITVNNMPRAPIDYRRKLRQDIYYLLKYKDSYYSELDYRTLLNSVMGRINWVLQIDPKDMYFLRARDLIYEVL